jgi:hypothetical protein
MRPGRQQRALDHDWVALTCTLKWEAETRTVHEGSSLLRISRVGKRMA